MRQRLRAARYLVDFDSGVNVARTLGRFLRGKDNRGLSVGPGSRRLADLASSLPAQARRAAFSAMGVAQGIPSVFVTKVGPHPSLCGKTPTN